MNGLDIIKILKKRGWTLKRIRGSHHVMEKNGITIPIPVHGTKDIGKDLLSEIQRQTGEKLK
ncbi:MAG: type II toxin-antitoxin system HicA family toxin [Candidatus Ozemobacteraceae bacterium]